MESHINATVSCYHEKQSFHNCGLHAVNNLLQGKIFTKTQFEEISKELEKKDKRSHSNWFIGDYDVNVVMNGIKLRITVYH
jgi:hypothetical protein